MANSRSIRDTLDAYSSVNASTNVGIATKVVDAITNYYEGLVGSTIFNWVGPNFMDDNGTNTYTGSYPFYTNIVWQHLLSGHGIDVSGNPQTNSNYGKLDGYGAYANYNQGLKHYNDSVQLGKGITTNIVPGSTSLGALGSGLLSGTSLDAVAAGNNTYRTLNIKMSDFRGLSSVDSADSSYVYNQQDGNEEIHSTGPIAVGDAVQNWSLPSGN